MSYRDFFRVVIKLFALYGFINVLYYFFPTIMQIGAFSSSATDLIFPIGIAVVIIALLLLLVYFADGLIDLLKLDKGLDHQAIDSIGITAHGIAHVGIIIIGGLIFIENITDFLSMSVEKFNDLIGTSNTPNVLDDFNNYKVNTYTWVQSGVLSAIGYLLITNYGRLGRWLVKQGAPLDNH
ncbi:MAG: hypothetical protein ABJM06_08005 [Gilvibacter sp.]